MRVSEASHRENLERQAERLTHYCTVRGYQVVKLVKEVGSGVNDSRPKLLSLLRDPLITRLVVEHKDRLTRFGFRYIETFWKYKEEPSKCSIQQKTTEKTCFTIEQA